MRRTRFLLALFAVLVLVVAGCSSDDDDGGGGDDAGSDATTATTEAAAPAEPATLDVTSSDYAYALSSESVPAGLVTVNQTNEGEENHQVTLVRLDDGQTAADLAEGLEAEGDHVTADSNYAGGPNGLAPGDTNSATSELEEGSYALICFIPAADGESHYVKGMVGELEVTAPEDDPAPEPETTEEVALSDFAFGVPDGFTGQGTIAVTNDGEQAHELTITTADGPAGGLAAIAPGQTAWLDLALEPESPYQFTCFVSDIDTGQPHFALGMTADVTTAGG